MYKIVYFVVKGVISLWFEVLIRGYIIEFKDRLNRMINIFMFCKKKIKKNICNWYFDRKVL